MRWFVYVVIAPLCFAIPVNLLMGIGWAKSPNSIANFLRAVIAGAIMAWVIPAFGNAICFQFEKVGFLDPRLVVKRPDAKVTDFLSLPIVAFVYTVKKNWMKANDHVLQAIVTIVTIATILALGFLVFVAYSLPFNL